MITLIISSKESMARKKLTFWIQLLKKSYGPLMGLCSIKSKSCRLPNVLQALAWEKPIFYVGLWVKKMRLKCIRWKTILSQVRLNLGIRKKKLKRSLRSWKNSQAMGLTVPMPMPILPWPFRWPISRSIIQMFSLMSCSIIRAAII